MPIVIAVLLGLAGLLIVLYPLLGIDPSVDVAAREALARVSEQEVSAKQALRDVDFDRRLGNLDDEDYRELRDRFEESALEAMKSRYSRERELDLAIDRQLQSLSDERTVTAASEKAAKSAPRAAGHSANRAKAAPTTPIADAEVGSPSTTSADAATRRASLRKRRGV